MNNLPNKCRSCSAMCFCEDGIYRCFHKEAKIEKNISSTDYKDYETCENQNRKNDCELEFVSKLYSFEPEDLFDIQYPEKDKGIRSEQILEKVTQCIEEQNSTGKYLIVELDRSLNYGQMRKLLPKKIWINEKPEFLMYLRQGDQIKTSLKWLDRNDQSRKIYTIRCAKQFVFCKN